MKKWIFFFVLFISFPAAAQELVVSYQNVGKKFFTHPDPESNTWNQLEATSILLFPQNITTPSRFQTSIAKAQVKALHNKKWTAFLL